LEESQKLLTWAYEHDCFLIDALFSEAFMYEKKRDFLKAIEVYDRILEKKPHHTAALKLKIRNIADLGMISSAYQLAQQEGIKDERFISDLESDMIIDRLKWEEENEAISLLEQQLKDYSENYRVLCDYIVALRKKERMEEVIEQFENVKSMGKPIPYWVTEAVADAYLYLEKPREALKFYKITLERKPYDVFDPLMGLFYSYQELRDWENANSTLKHIKEIMSKEKLDKWQRLEATMAQGWYHIHRDELDDAQDYFESYLTQAGMNTDFRTGLAHVYLWRGRPRKALQELKIAENIAPDDVDVQSGMILTLEELNAKKKARALAEKLNQKFPTKKQLRDTYDTLKVEDMNKFTTKALFVNENPGSQEYWISSLLEEPLFPTLKLFQEITWQKTSDDSVGGKTEFKWNRAGLGGEWIVKQPLIWKQALTFDYQEGDEFGYDTTLTWTPKDRLKITAGYDSFYLDIPIRARAEGIEGEHAFWDIYWHEHEARQYGFSSGYTWYDDRNLNSYYTLYLDQRVLNTPDFNIRLGGQVHYSTNKKTDVSYFSPLNEFTFLLKPTFHWIHFLRYNRKFQSNLYFRFGVYKQHLFDYHTIGGITYEQMIALSKTFEFLWNVSWDQKVYDGDAADVWEGSCILKKSF
ncbi:MAG: hypothetical protein SVW57_03110, partial [Thermodesulfobacteriota bacterium]|nr:hypothetical protein [Thermodesulfobacteriota bacterium]